MNTNSCCKRIWDRFHDYQCKKAAVVERDGEWFCKVHDPVYVKEKRERHRKRWEAEYESNRIKFKRQLLYEQILGDKTIEELKNMAKAVVK